MFIFSAGKYSKPNRISDRKDEKYHADFAKYCIANGFDSSHNKFIEKASIIKNFYSNNQWISEEDTEAFLKDESGGETGRIKVAFNIIRPLIEQYRGNAININLNASAKSSSGMSRSRKDKALAEALMLTDEINGFFGDGLKARLRQSVGVGKDASETTSIFENAYTDAFSAQINKLLRFSSEMNEFKQMQLPLSQDMAFSGLAVTEAFEHGEHLRFEQFPSILFFWDRSANRSDLRDSQFMGRLDLIDPTMVFERWPNMERQDKILMEEYTKTVGEQHNYRIAGGLNQNNAYNHMSGYGGMTSGAVRVPQYKVFWRDHESYEYGWVIDEDGFESLERINYDPKGGDNYTYTEKDVIEPPKNPENDKMFMGRKTIMHDVDTLRYCILIPKEVFSGMRKDQMQSEARDIVLEYGEYPYQEYDWRDVNNVKFPFKAQTWAYIDGEVLTPIDSVINPQRFINRILSVQESHVNTSGGAGVVIDQASIVGTGQSEEDVITGVKRGLPLVINTKHKGVQNMVGTYDTTPSQGAYKMTDMVTGLYEFVQRMTGVNDPLQGQSTGPDQLVGVTKLMIQKGSLVQEPFYYAISDLFLQMYQHIATVGKIIYLNNEKELNVITGSGGDEVLKLSEGMRNEEFRMFINRENPDDILKDIANQEILLFAQLGFLTQADVSDLWSRSTPEDVQKRMRETAAAMVLNDKRKAESGAAAYAAALKQNEDQENAQMQKDYDFKSADIASKMAAINQKDQGDRLKAATQLAQNAPGQ